MVLSSRTMKLFVLGILVGASIILGSAVVSLQFIVHKRRGLLQRRREKHQSSSSKQTPPSFSSAATATHADFSKLEDNNSSKSNLKNKRQKTVRSTLAPHPHNDLFLSHNLYSSTPDGTSAKTVADAHLSIALRFLDYEVKGGTLEGNALPPELLWGEYSKKARGVGFVKDSGSWEIMRFGDAINRRNVTAVSGDTNTIRILGLSVKDFVPSMEEWMNTAASCIGSLLGVFGWKMKRSVTTMNDDDFVMLDNNETTYQREKMALYHLQKAAELGNHHAQNMLAMSLVNGILPMDDNSPSLRSALLGNQTVPADFTEGGNQLAKAIILWHMSAMDGNIEAAMALGYRHRYSAMAVRNSINLDVTNSANIITDQDVSKALVHRDLAAKTQERGERDSTPLNKKNKQQHSWMAHTHSASPTTHYGVLGTCESALLYYEAAAHAIMDNLESSPLRGKVAPAQDRHRLAEIHMHGGASSALPHYNKPDELEEALQYYKIKASRNHSPSPDVHAAFTLANLYHYGMRGVKQDMRLALKYYEIAADNNSWEAAGQAGKFHLWGMGVADDVDENVGNGGKKDETVIPRDLLKAYKYFKMGTPGALDGCTRRFHAKADYLSKKRKRKALKRKADSTTSKPPPTDENDEKDNTVETWEDFFHELEEEAEIGPQCDHPCVNGMGLLYFYGIPMVLPVNTTLAHKYFSLARDMGNMDASYHLGMMQLGWMDDKLASGNNITATPKKDNSVNGKLTAESSSTDSFEGNVEADNDDMPADMLADLTAKAMKLAEAMLGPNLADTNNIKVEVVQLGKELQSRFEASAHKAKTGKPKTLTKADYSLALSLLTHASNKGHMQAKHRVAMLYSRGVQIPDPKNSDRTQTVITKSCPKALHLYKEIADSGTTISRRTRAAYKQYMAGDYKSSLRNYLAAAETGSVIGQINAAFLLEQGNCLGMSQAQCMRASVRLWRAAARQGNEEACLRVGDFYYYGRLREDEDSSDIHHVANRSKERVIAFAMSPYPWIQYILFPEDLWPIFKKQMVCFVRWVASSRTSRTSDDGSEKKREESVLTTCPAGTDVSKEGACIVPQQPVKKGMDGKKINSGHDDHLTIAAQYYRRAAEEHESARANFNLGFMHEWGLGLTQDFPLAKRHYDLAASSGRGEGALAVQIALLAMNVHQKLVKFGVVWNDWWSRRTVVATSKKDVTGGRHSTFWIQNLLGRKAKINETPLLGKVKMLQISKTHVFMKHLLTWESALIFMLTILLTRIIQYRQTQQRRR